MFLRLSILAFAIALATPATAQFTITMGAGSGGGGSTATVTTEQVGPAPAFDGDFAGAAVLTGVNVRNAPNSRTSQIVGTLQQGGTVMARCKLGWCELQDGGYVGQKFLSFTATGSFDVVPQATQPASPDTAALSPDSSTTSLAPPTGPNATAANFDGAWTVTNDPSQHPVPLTLAQSNTGVTGIITGQSRVTKITGQVEGTKLSFTYQMANAKGAAVATGNGFLTLATGGQSLTGVLMLNGLVVSNINAVRATPKT